MIYRKFRRGRWWVIRRVEDSHMKYSEITNGIRYDMYNWLNKTYGKHWFYKRTTHCPSDPSITAIHYNDIRDFKVLPPSVFTLDIYLPNKEDITTFILTWETGE